MKPLKIEMSAFGSYAGHTVIDFSNLTAGLFLVTGDTGSGKTTLFDAIVYALYDQTSGGLREGRMMRSQYASSEDKTFVTLTFICRGETYTITRSPEYERASKRKKADGTVTMTKEKSAVSLIMPNGEAFRGRKKDIDQKIAEIIGLDAGQFMQVSMIAQGDFMKLLYASSKDRKVIFSKIFRTGLYWRIQENLKNEAVRCYGKLEDARKKYCQELGRTVTEKGSEEEQMLTELLMKNYPDADQVDMLLENVCKKDEANYRTVDTRRRKIEMKLELLRKEEGELKHRQEAGKRFEEAGINIRRLQEKIQHQEEEKKAAKARLELCADRREAQAEDLQSRIYQIRHMLPLYDTLFEKEQFLQKAAGQMAVLLDKQDAVGGQLEQMEKQKVQYESILSEGADLSKQMIRMTHQQNEWAKRLERLQILLGQMEKRMYQEERCRKAKKAHEEADQIYLELNAAYEKLYHLFLAEQAGILAERLQEKKPCPVCGSLAHPSPAVLPENAPDQQDVDRAGKRAEEARNRRQQYMADCQKQYGIFQEMNASLEREGRLLLADQWRDDKELITHLIEQYRDKKKELDGAVSQLKKKLEEQEQIKKARISLEQRKSAAETEKQKLQKDMQELEERQMILKGEVASLQSQLVYNTKEEAVVILNQSQIQLAELEEAVRDAKAVCVKLENDSERLAGQLQAAFAEEKKALAAVEEIRKRQNPDERNFRKLEEIETELEDMRDRKEEADGVCQELYAVRSGNLAVCKNIQKSRTEYDSLKGQYEVLQNLNRTANGSLAGSTKIDLETYVLRYYFRQIIDAANRRLIQMNGRQFLLKCTSVENLGNRGEAGLNLDVYSLVTGSIRDVKTLSGGESFMAALSMALGMADMIGCMAGAVQVDTMFVDEGFGSLDDASRNHAVHILQQLAGSSRMIGIISHVNELRDCIDCQLRVKKTERGSFAEWL